MKAPVGLLSDRTVLRSKMEGPRPDKFTLTRLDFCGILSQQLNITYLLRVPARLPKEPEQIFNFLSLHNEPEPRPSRKGWSGSGCCVAIFYCQIVVQIIHQICDLREALAFHNDKSADHGFFGEAPPPGFRPGQREVQTAEKLVVERSGALGCKQCHILNDFLSVDSGQPLSGWFSLKSILPKRGSAFYTI